MSLNREFINNATANASVGDALLSGGSSVENAFELIIRGAMERPNTSG